MAQAIIHHEPDFPWVDSPEDRRFRRFAWITLLVFMSLGLILNFLTLPEPEQRKLVDVSPRLAKLILEKQKVKPPPPPKKEIPKPEVKKEAAKKKPAAKKKAPPVVKKESSAREKAKQSGLIALSDELSDLRESFNLDDSLNLPQQTGGKKALQVETATELLASQAKQTSGGINTQSLTRKVETSELVGRKTTSVSSSIESTQKTKQKLASQSSRTSARNEQEIELVFQKNKGAIFAIYNRELRKNPSLQGKVVVEITIDAKGSVISAKIVSSELNNKGLERKLILKIKRFKFASTGAPKITITYPIDFLPS